jgi:hypothetical protein
MALKLFLKGLPSETMQLLKSIGLSSKENVNSE